MAQPSGSNGMGQDDAWATNGMKMAAVNVTEKVGRFTQHGGAGKAVRAELSWGGRGHDGRRVGVWTAAGGVVRVPPAGQRLGAEQRRAGCHLVGFPYRLHSPVHAAEHRCIPRHPHSCVGSPSTPALTQLLHSSSSPSLESRQYPPPSSPTLWLHSIRQELEDKERRLRENILLNYHRIKDVERELSDLQVRHGLLCFDVLLALLLLLLQ